MSGETDLDVLLRTMRPELHDGAYEFSVVVTPSSADLDEAVVIVRETEGVTLVRPATEANPEAMAWITLTVHSSLQAVGLTAAVSAALAAEQIPCNVVAGFHHDHLFVPYRRRADAMSALIALAA